MKLSEQWLREWVNPQADIQQIADRLVMGGLELEIEPVVEAVPSHVVVGRIVAIQAHPDADRLRVCEVDVGGGMKTQIVCGASNARQGLVAPVALPGATLPSGMEIKPVKLRGVDSKGMLCSANELGIAEQSDGLLELDEEAPRGAAIGKYLQLDDHILNLEITPNRGDCLSVVGLAREIAALFDVQLRRPHPRPAVVVGAKRHAVEVENADDCPSYTGRVIYGIGARARTPDYMRERLRRSGIRSLYPLVDITNYVMLELGQPMHAFDGSRLSGTVSVRRARDGESLQLLNDQELELKDQELLICDETGPVALAGVMGGASTAVSASSARVFFESACFSQKAVAGTGRRHKIATDALYRFERGVDPDLQKVALERATELTLQICGGEAGPISFAGRVSTAPVALRLRHQRLKALLGHDIPAGEVESLLGRLGIRTRHEVGGVWSAQVPSWRYDLRIEPDLIEEVARLYGYDRIPAKPYAAHLAPGRPSESRRSLHEVKRGLVGRGWQEIVSLAFADREQQALLNPMATAVELDNPIADNQSLMRSTLWCGLIESWNYNAARQQERLRLFEHGVCFDQQEDGSVSEMARLSGLMAGPVWSEQWSGKSRPADFYDIKAEVVALFDRPEDLSFDPVQHPALHPGRSARIALDGVPVGWIGQLHPGLVEELDLPGDALLFEIIAEAVIQSRTPRAKAVPEFPTSRRDISLVVDEKVAAAELMSAARKAAPASLKEAFVFDVYRGDRLGKTLKSMALGLIFQDNSRTLTDEEVESAVEGIKADLSQQFGAVDRR